MGKLKVGIIGTGGIANGKHIPALLANADLCEIVALCDIDVEKAYTTKEKFELSEAKVYEDYKELLADENIEVVHVCTPNVSHAQISIDAFEAGKHVMCEKPMAATVSDAEKMIEAWKKSGKKFTVGYQNRFRHMSKVLKASCDAGELGDIYYAEANAIRRRAVPTWGVFTDKAQQGGGPLIDIGTHALDLTLWCMNNYDVESVTGQVFYKLGSLPKAAEGNAWGPWDTEKYEVEDSAMGFIKMKNGALINLRAAWALNYMDQREACTTLCGTLQGAELKHGGIYPEDELHFNGSRHGRLCDEEILAGKKSSVYEKEPRKDKEIEAEQWLKCIIDDTEPVTRPEQALVVTKILEAIYTSAKEGRTITF